MIMRMLVDAKWLRVIVSIHAFFAFFMGVFFMVWGPEFESPPWQFVFSMPGGHAVWGSLLLASGGLFLLGMDWNAKWPRFFGGLLSGVTYVALGTLLGLAPVFHRGSFNGSWPMWMFAGAMSVGLAFLMKEMQKFAENDRRF